MHRGGGRRRENPSGSPGLSRAGRRGHLVRRAGDILARAIERPEILRAARAGLILDRWSDVVGDFLAAKSRPDRYERGTVFVAVSGSAWAQELRMRREEILDGLREISGEPSLFINIRFGVRALPNPPQVPAPDQPYELPPEELSIREIANRRLAIRKREAEAQSSPSGSDSP
ncbi:DUF721 domain-containing protein [bacterium]|nr:MAG: DUF721 domain-containing protein [bacterium]